ncbi:flotillin-like protein FloA [Candidatus Sumerlaeota bacterium]|nr:flotillin-like protein FloA [Candidatus Sumerlaeota bacterium]
MDPTVALGIGIVAFIVIFLWLFVWLIPIKLWIAALMTRTPVGLLDMIGMRLRRVSPALIVNPLIAAVQARVEASRVQLESHYLAQGNVWMVVQAMISASKAKLDLTLDQACAIDLAGRNVLDAVRMSVEPRVIDCPNPQSGRQTIDAVAKDGIQLRAKARVTVRANLERLIGGATEETIIARVGEGIVSSIGSANSHKDVLENPDSISKKVLAKGLDSGTAFSILSIDIADVDVGQNIGAKLQIDQAEADKQIAQARAEQRRAMAVAAEQEFRAREQEMRAKLVESESQVPLAIADAFRQGRLGIMDYYNMRNIMADTEMRSSISKGYEEGPKPGDPNRRT